MNNQRTLTRFTKYIFLISLLLFVEGCTPPQQRELKKAQDLIQQREFSEALGLLDKLTLRGLDKEYAVQAAREAAKICFYDLKNFEKAKHYYGLLILYSKKPDERLFAQKQIVSIYFDQLSDYPNAIKEINKLIGLIKESGEKIKYRSDLARAYYYRNNFDQSINEVEELLKQPLPDDERFQLLILKGNTFLAQKNIDKTANLFRDIMSKYPERAVKENVALTLAVAYEEMKDYKSAISTLEAAKSIYPDPSYLQIRINRLKERQKNLPGARGIRK